MKQLVSDRFLARTFIAMPAQIVNRLAAMGIEPVEVRDDVAYFDARVVDRLRALSQRAWTAEDMV